jgi:glucosamine--fructose-6-phosphate aminotransferase (isomerizing)
MCGIIGYIGPKDVVSVLMDSLKRLEYRGYDSAGIAVVQGKNLRVLRSAGKLRDLEETLRLQPIEGTFGVGHTRWATHGRPTEENAHPHRDCTGELVVVHNGIIENYLDLKKELQEAGHKFQTETDTEVIAHLLEQAYNGKLETALREVLPRLKGVYALAAITTREPNVIAAARMGPPIVIGLGTNEYFVSSDVPAILYHTRDMLFLQDREIAHVTPQGVQVCTYDGEPVTREAQRITWDPIMAEKSGFKHFMLKEIYEQPRAIRDTLLGRMSLDTGRIFLDEMEIPEEEFKQFNRAVLVACGTSWHAALVGKYLIETLAGIPVEVDYSSEFRYRRPELGPDVLVMAITQSGETADTLAAMREAKRQGRRTAVICNVVGSIATREADAVIYTHAGPEIGVASTKTFTTQVVALHLFALYLATLKGRIDTDTCRTHLQGLSRLPAQIEGILGRDNEIESLAKEHFRATDFLFLGRGINYPIALEGALKLKEISYIHAEGYPAGEMKHGPIALIDRNLPVVALAVEGGVFEKMMGNMEEVRAREGTLITMATEGNEEVLRNTSRAFFIPKTDELLTPVLLAVPLQLLAYHIALLRGCDVDQPRNLAKSVTVE